MGTVWYNTYFMKAGWHVSYLNKQTCSVSPQLGVRTKRIKTACEIIFTLNVPQTFDPKQLALFCQCSQTSCSSRRNMSFHRTKPAFLFKKHQNDPGSPMGHRKGPSFYIKDLLSYHGLKQPLFIPFQSERAGASFKEGIARACWDFFFKCWKLRKKHKEVTAWLFMLEVLVEYYIPPTCMPFLAY